MSLGEYQLSPLLHQALLHAQYEAESRGDTLRIDFRNFSDLQKLRFFSKVLEGPLKKMGGIGAGWQPIYVKAVEKKSGKWEWRYWRSKEDCLVNEVHSYFYFPTKPLRAAKELTHYVPLF